MTYGVIGGDRRQMELAILAAEEGNTVVTYGLGAEGTLKEALQAEVILLPLPLSREGYLNCGETSVPVDNLFSQLRPCQRILAGQVKDAEYKMAVRYGLTIEDYFLREELTVANAAITAECAIRIAEEHLGASLPPVLVLGFGRIGKLLCHRFQKNGVPVTVAARKTEDKAWAKAYGYEILDIRALSGKIFKFGLVLNTVPEMVLKSELAMQLAEDCLCIDLASQKGIELPEGDRCIWARGLPGKMEPKAAALTLWETVKHILAEQRGEYV